MKKQLVTSLVTLSLASSSAYAAISIQLNFTDIGEGGVNGSGITQAQQAAFTNAKATWEKHLTGYRDTGGPTSVAINISGPAIDGPGMVLGSAGPRTTTTTTNFTYASSGEMRFDSADIAALVANGSFESVIFHEMGHVLGSGTLWQQNGVYTAGSFRYTGARALENYKRDFDPNATFVPVENDGGPGTAEGHWNEDPSNPSANNPNAPYNGKPFNSEVMTGFSNGAENYLSDVTLGMFYDIGYTVQFIVPTGPFHWDAGNPTNDNAITSGDGVWDLVNNNFAKPGGAENVKYQNRSLVTFGDKGSRVTLAGVFTPSVVNIEADGYTFINGGLDTENNLQINVTNAAHTLTLNSPVTGTNALTLGGRGTVNNLNTISSQILLNSGTLINNGSGTITGNTTIASGASLQTDAGGLGSGINITNNGDLQISADQTITGYSGGGKLSGAGKLTADSYALTNGASIESDILKGNITANGAVALLGASAGNLTVQSGVTTLRGANSGTNVNISSGAELRSSANTLNDAAAVVNAGTLNLLGNEKVASYDGTGGTLKGVGKFSVNSFRAGTVETSAVAKGTLGLTVDANNGAVTLGAGSTLKFDTAGQEVGVFDVFNLFSNTSGIVGDNSTIGFGSFDTSALDSGVRAVFDVSTGNIIITSGSASGSTPNESAVATALVGGSRNLVRMSNVAGIQGGANANVLARLFALANASTTDNVTVRSQLQELSPEVYTSVADYSLRQHLSYTDTVRYAPYMVRTGKFQVFAGANSQNIETSSSLDDADYKLKGTGGYFGVANQFSQNFRVGIYAAHDNGDITSERLKLESTGSVVGAFAEFEVLMPWENDQKRGTITAGFSVGSFDYDGTRTAQGLTNNVDGIQADTIELGLGYKVALIDNPYFKLSPFVSANHITSEVDSFTETGSINSLTVRDHEKTLILLNYGMEAEWKPNADAFGITAKIGFQNNFGDDQAEFQSAFAGGNNFDILAPGLSDTTIEARLGMFYYFSNAARIGASYFVLSGDDIESASGGNVGFSLQW